MMGSIHRITLAYALTLLAAVFDFRFRPHGWSGARGTTASSLDLDRNSSSTATPRETGSSRSGSGRDRGRLYCMVPFIWTPRFFPNYRAIKSTWGKRCDFLRFTVDAVVGDETVGFYNLTVPSEASAAREARMYPPDDVAVLHNMQRPWHCVDAEGKAGLCGNTWEKTYRSFQWVGINEGDVAEWYAKVDLDTYLFPNNALRFVETRGWTPDEPRNFGHTLTNAKQKNMPKCFNAGAAYFFSGATMPLLAAMIGTFDIDEGARVHPGCFARGGRGEDITLAQCIYGWTGEFSSKEYNTRGKIDGVKEIVPEGTLDDEGNELISLAPLQEMLYKGREDYVNEWYWRGKEITHPETGKEMHVCCGVRPIAFHGYKDSRWFYKLEQELYGETDSLENADADDWRGLDWNNTEIGGYFEKVRKAMMEDGG